MAATDPAIHANVLRGTVLTALAVALSACYAPQLVMDDARQTDPFIGIVLDAVAQDVRERELSRVSTYPDSIRPNQMKRIEAWSRADFVRTGVQSNDLTDSARLTNALAKNWDGFETTISEIELRGGVCKEDSGCRVLVPVETELDSLSPFSPCMDYRFLLVTLTGDGTEGIKQAAWQGTRIDFHDLPYQGIEPRDYYQLFVGHDNPCRDIPPWVKTGPEKRVLPNLRD
ncbi:MAG: hypothetical protein Alpg2KO_17510 [Alphaproteobacteria bacterium]